MLRIIPLPEKKTNEGDRRGQGGKGGADNKASQALDTQLTDTDSSRITNLLYDFTMRRVRLYPLTNHSRGHGRSRGRTVRGRAAHGKKGR